MSFTVKEFPNKVFESMKEYKLCVELRNQLREMIKNKVITKFSTVEIAKIIKKDDPVLQLLIGLIKGVK